MLLKEYGVANPLATSVGNYFYRDYVTGYDTMPLSTLGYKYTRFSSTKVCLKAEKSATFLIGS